MDTNLALLANQTVEGLKAVWTSGGREVALAMTSRGLYDWLKGAFSKKPLATAALEEASKQPDSTDALETLAIQIRKLAKEDEEFRSELVKRVGAMGQRTSQSAKVSGTGHVVIQNTGNGSSFQIPGGSSGSAKKKKKKK